MAIKERQWYIVGCYLAPGDNTMIQDVDAAMAEWLRGTELIVMGELNVDLKNTGGQERYEEIAAAVKTSGL